MKVSSCMYGWLFWLTFGVATFGSEFGAADLAEKACDAISKGQLADGTILLQRAITLGKRDVQLRSANSAIAPNAESLDDAERQFRRLSLERPAILEFKHHPGFESLRQWVIHRFAGKGTGISIVWDGARPEGEATGSIAEHRFSPLDKRAFLRISKALPDHAGKIADVPFERLWHSVAFECMNVSYAEHRERLFRMAFDGEISQADFVTEIFYTEFKAIRETHVFYCDVYLPFVQRANLHTEPRHWYLDRVWWMNPEDAIDSYSFAAEYPWGCYGRLFREIRLRPGAKPRVRVNHNVIGEPAPLPAVLPRSDFR